MMDPALVNANLIQLIELRGAELRKGHVHPKHVLELARMFRRLGCGELVSGNDTATFFFCLFRAADLWLQFLERKQTWTDPDPYYMARGRAEPLLDALALGDVATVTLQWLTHIQSSRMAASVKLSGAGTDGFPRLKSKTFSFPISFPRTAAYSASSRITDLCPSISR